MNIRWVTRPENNRNKRNNVFIEYDGKVQILADWAKDYSKSRACVANRLRLGWSIERALNQPVERYNTREIRDQYKTVKL